MEPATAIMPLLTGATAKRGVPRLEQPKPADEKAAKLLKLDKASKDFEAIFLNELLRPLTKSLSSSSQGSQLGGDIMMAVAVEKMAETLADKGGIGLGNMLMQTLKDRVIDDAVPDAAQEDTKSSAEREKIILKELDPEETRAPMMLNGENVMPLHPDKSQTNQVR